MAVRGVIPSSGGSFSSKSVKSTQQSSAESTNDPLLVTSPDTLLQIGGADDGVLLSTLGVAHSISIDPAGSSKIINGGEGQLTQAENLRGDPLDLKMFEFTGWVIIELTKTLYQLIQILLFLLSDALVEQIRNLSLKHARTSSKTPKVCRVRSKNARIF